MIFAIILALMTLGFAFIDWVYLRKVNRRSFQLEYVAFAVVLVMAYRPIWFSDLARFLGVTRGVDVVIYPMMIWLFREAVLGRVRYHRHKAELTGVVRQMAIAGRIEVTRHAGASKKVS